MIDAYRKACVDATRQTGETIDQGLESWAETDDAGLERPREWKGSMLDDVYSEHIHDPASHVRKVKAIQQSGATAVVSMSVSGADPLGTLRTYGRDVLPALPS